MKQQEFERRHESEWSAFEQLLGGWERAGRTRRTAAAAGVEEFPARYRRLCQQLALARDRDYATNLCDRLNSLVLRGHQHLYQTRAGIWSRVADTAAIRFPARVRIEARLFWLAAVVLYLPMTAMAVVVLESPDMVYAVFEPEEVVRLEQMYRPDADHWGRERGSDSDFMMFGHYIHNNIGIGFRTFASGLLFGLGSLFFLTFNGVHLGAVAGHLMNAGSAQPFFSFVIAHGAFELTAIVLAGMAGLKLGLALIAPGRLTRRRALREAARESVVIVYGMVAMLVLAAFVEAFWSSTTTVPAALKYAVGAGCWVLVGAYFLLLGRSRGSR